MPSCRNHPTFLWNQIELAIEKLVVRPGSLHQRLLDLRGTLLILPSDLPTYRLATEWAVIRAAFAALPEVTCDLADEAAIAVASSLLDFRSAFRDSLLRDEVVDNADTAA